MKIVIIDDENNAVEALKLIIDRINGDYIIVGATTNPYEAIGIILQQKPDIVFLDIEMPHLTGFELLEILPEIDFEIIFATAYEHYAIEAIKKNAIGYIVKPVSISSVKEALLKAEEKQKSGANKSAKYQNLLADVEKPTKSRIKIATASGFEFIDTDAIIRLEADNVYTKAIIERREKIIITKPLKKLEEELNLECFFRTHRSHLINTEHVYRFDSLKNSVIMSDNSTVPIARRRIREFKDLLNKHF
ncbi:MAG: LytTR family DNA-binding domain-containing protein [Salinivirgaceae bacterium]